MSYGATRPNCIYNTVYVAEAANQFLLARNMVVSTILFKFQMMAVCRYPVMLFNYGLQGVMLNVCVKASLDE